MKLDFPELYFNSAHYIYGHPTCGCIHGHTYFVRNLIVDITGVMSIDPITGISFDFGVIKQCVKDFDHKFFVQAKHITDIRKLLNLIGLKDNCVLVKYGTAEYLSEKLRAHIATTLQILQSRISLKLFEGPKQAVSI